MIKVLRFIWELPQNIIGFTLSLGSDSEQLKLNDNVSVKVYYKDLHKKSKGEAVTLGEFIESWANKLSAKYLDK